MSESRDDGGRNLFFPTKIVNLCHSGEQSLSSGFKFSPASVSLTSVTSLRLNVWK